MCLFEEGWRGNEGARPLQGSEYEMKGAKSEEEVKELPSPLGGCGSEMKE